MTKYTKTFAEAMQEVREKKSAFRISYSKQGTHAGFEDADSLPDLQKKAADLRSKGFTIDKMGRNTSPIKEDYEVSMAVGQLKTIQERVGKIMDFLSGKSDDYNMEAWLQSKITSAEDKLNSVANYVTNNPEINEANLDVDNVNKGDSDKEKELKIKLDKEKDTDTLERQIVTLQGQLNIAKQKLENEKNKVVKPEANPETGEVPLRTGLANAILDKKMNTKDLVQSKKKKEIPVGGKTKIEVNPDKDIGNFSGGMRVNSGNLH
jgi:hypothetical protein